MRTTSLKFNCSSWSSQRLCPLNKSRVFSGGRWSLVTEGADCPASVQVLAQSHLNWSNRLICCGRAGSSCHAEIPGHYSIVGFFDLLRLSLMTHLALNPNGSISISLFFCSKISNYFHHFTFQIIFNGSSVVYQAVSGTHPGWVWFGFNQSFSSGSFMLWCSTLPHLRESHGRRDTDSPKGQGGKWEACPIWSAACMTDRAAAGRMKGRSKTRGTTIQPSWGCDIYRNGRLCESQR